MTKVLTRFMIKEGTTVDEVMKNGNEQQKKYACVFDQNSDGKYTGDEVRLFNSTATKENDDGSITFWTNFTSGRKEKNTIAQKDLKNATLVLGNSLGNEKVYKQTREAVSRNYLKKGYTLISENPITGTKKYKKETFSSEEILELSQEEQKLDLKTYVTTDRYGKELEISAPVELAAENYWGIQGRAVTRGNEITYFDNKGNKLGFVEIMPDGKEKVVDNKGSVLFYVGKWTGRDIEREYYDKNEKHIGNGSAYFQTPINYFIKDDCGRTFLEGNNIGY